MKLSAYTKPEIDYFRENCNFVGNEIDVFEYKCLDITEEHIAYYTGLTVSGVKYVTKKIRDKIMRVVYLYFL